MERLWIAASARLSVASWASPDVMRVYDRSVVTREEMLALVRAHSALDEPMETAIWIRQTDREAWLVELIPALRVDAHPERPVAFNAGLSGIPST